MKKMTFKDKDKTLLLFLFKIFMSDQTQHKDKLVIRQLARISDKLEEHIMVTTSDTGSMFNLRNMNGDDIEVNFEDSEFDRLSGIVNDYQVRTQESVIMSKMYSMFDEVSNA